MISIKREDLIECILTALVEDDRKRPSENPLYDLWMHHGNMDIDAQMAQDRQSFRRTIRARSHGIRRWSYAVPSPEAIKAIAALSPIVEIGAGTGYWAKLLTAAGADVIAYDNYNSKYQLGRHFPVQSGSELSGAKHPDRTLLLCWPPYESSMAYRAALAWKGKYLVYIGEDCTADDEFHEMLAQEKHYKLERVIPLPNWPGLHDRVMIYRRL